MEPPNITEQEQAAQKILDDTKERARQDRVNKNFAQLRKDVTRLGILDPGIDRHYTESHRLKRCTCFKPEQWPK